jgi:hypothetical protein
MNSRNMHGSLTKLNMTQANKGNQKEDEDTKNGWVGKWEEEVWQQKERQLIRWRWKWWNKRQRKKTANDCHTDDDC